MSQNETQETQESPEIRHYTTWEQTHAVIAVAYIEYVKKQKKKPSIRALAKVTGYAINTVHAHIKELQKKTLEERLEPFRLLTDNLILNLYKNGMKTGHGATVATKLFFELVENWKPGMKVELEGTADLRELSIKELLEMERKNGNDIERKLLDFAGAKKTVRKTGTDKA